MANDKLKQLQEILSIVNKDTMSNADFVNAFAEVVKLIKSLEQKHRENREKLESDIEKLREKLLADNAEHQNEAIEKVISDLKKRADEIFNEQQSNLNFLRDKARDIKDGRDGVDGKDADEKKIIDAVLKKIELPDTEELEERLEKKLEEQDEKIRAIPRGGRMGGIGDGNVRFSLGRIVKKETPSGAINGANTTYTVNQPIHAVLSFAINGQSITDDEYTASGKTITMNDPIDASLSGKSFRIVYV